MSKKQRTAKSNQKPISFFPLVIAIIADVREKILRRAGRSKSKAEENLPPGSDNSGIGAIGLPGSKWLFEASTGAASEIDALYNSPGYPSTSGGTNSNELFIDPDMGVDDSTREIIDS